MITPGDTDKRHILTEYRKARNGGNVAPHTAMLMIRNSLAYSCMTRMADGDDINWRLVYLWKAADDYIKSMYNRPVGYWFTKRRSA